MNALTSKLLSTTVIPIMVGVGVFAVAAVVAPEVPFAASNPCAAKNPCNPCAAKNPCAAGNPCNPCAAKNPCAAGNPCNPCAAKNPCAAGNPCNPCAAKNPCAATGAAASMCVIPRLRAAALSNPCAAKNPCNPCAAKNPCNPCAAANPCAAKNPCNPCAAKNPCNPCAAANPCAAKNPCNPCAAKNPCNPCAAANPCNPGAAANPCNPCAANPCAAGGGVELTDAESGAAYECIRGTLKAGYSKSGLDVAGFYQDWTRYSRVAYQSDTHGGRMVQNYGNAQAKNYGKFEDAGPMAVGAIIAKDSFSVTGDGKVGAGPFFLMEKMPNGFNKTSGNWRYTLVMPDGNVFGITNGKGSDNVAFCIECHAGNAELDHLFFLPDEYRVKGN